MGGGGWSALSMPTSSRAARIGTKPCRCPSPPPAAETPTRVTDGDIIPAVGCWCGCTGTSDAEAGGAGEDSGDAQAIGGDGSRWCGTGDAGGGGGESYEGGELQQWGGE